MPKLIIAPTARDDLKKIKNYIAEDNKQAAIAYIKKLHQTCKKLAVSPKIGTEEEQYCNLRKFPIDSYLIFYREQRKGIEVVRVLHSARDIEAILGK